LNSVSSSDPPSVPWSVSVLGHPEPESVVLTWLNPINLGTPVFATSDVYLCTTTEEISEKTIQVIPDNTKERDYNNTVTINGLKPNVQYTVTITTVSKDEQFGRLISEPSDEVAFNTPSRG